jgi:hypothetical protein
MTQSRSVPRRHGIVVGPVAMTAIALIGLQFLVRLIIIPQAYWWEDDFFHLAQARTMGLQKDFLVSDYNDHLEILPNFLWWLLTQITSSSWAPAAVLILVLSTTASAMMYLLLRELFGSRPAILLPLAAYLFSPLALAAVTWLAACIDSLPMQIALLGTPFAMLRFARSGRSRWLVLALVLHAVGLLAWEKGALVLPFALGLQVLVVDAGVPLRERLARLRGAWLAWLAHGLLLASYLVLYFNVVDGSERREVAGVDYLEGARISIFRVLVPGLFGAPWKRGDAENTVYPDPGTALAVVFAVLLGIVFVLSILKNRRAALGPWLLAAGYVGADVALMLWGRAGFLTLVARDPRYVMDAVPVVLICVAAAFLIRKPPGASDVAPGLVPADLAVTRAGLAVAGVAATVVTAGSLLTTFQLAPVLQHAYARDYVEGVAVRSEPDPGTSIIDTRVPKLVSGNVDHQRLMLAMGRRVTFDQPSTRMQVFDAAARLVVVDIADPDLVKRGPDKDCGWAVTDTDRSLTEVPEDVGKGRVLRAGVLTGVAGTLTVSVGDLEQSVDVPAGLGYAFFYLPSPEGEIVASFESEDGSGTCVTDLRLGPPSTVD